MKAPLQRNVRATPADLVIARRRMMLGVLLALREAEQQALKPEDQIDSLLAALEMPPADAGFGTHDFRHAAAGQMAGDGAPGMTEASAAAISTAMATVPSSSAAMPSETSSFTPLVVWFRGMVVRV